MDQTALNSRIAQFENMVREGADPTNDMAWFSLGQAYVQAARPADAAAAFIRCYELNPAMSKAYQLAGKALIESDQHEKALGVLNEGYTSAASRGDRMPMQAMADLLNKLGHTPPQVAQTAAQSAAPTGTFMCSRTGRPGHQMDRPPFKGAVGNWIQQNISKETFEDWIRQGTKVINEMRLDLSREEDSDKYDRFMREYLGIDDELHQKLTSGG